MTDAWVPGSLIVESSKKAGVLREPGPVGRVVDRSVGGILRVRRLRGDHLPGLLFGEVHFGVYLVGVGQSLLN